MPQFPGLERRQRSLGAVLFGIGYHDGDTATMDQSRTKIDSGSNGSIEPASATFMVSHTSLHRQTRAVKRSRLCYLVVDMLTSPLVQQIPFCAKSKRSHQFYEDDIYDLCAWIL